MKRSICILLTFCLLLCTSCSNAKSDLPGNVIWDMTQSQVTQTVGEDRIIEGSSDGILNWLQTQELNNIYGERTVSVAYIFADDALRSITVQVFINEGESIEDAKKATRTAMEGTLGTATEADGSLEWQSESSSIKLQDVTGAQSFFVVLYAPI